MQPLPNLYKFGLHAGRHIVVRSLPGRHAGACLPVQAIYGQTFTEHLAQV
jgi:hypothetical protein